MKNIELRKKLFTVYYDKLKLKQQAEVLKKLGLNDCQTLCDSAFLKESELCSINVYEWAKVMRSVL